jgi:glycosyltransferase involved in cell wall biosynthesis
VPRVSVLINSYNSAATLKAAIDSALNQTWRDLEVIVFDNGSTDGTPALCAGYADARLRYLRQDPTIMLGAARNRVMEAAQGDYLAFLDADDSWMPQKLEKQVAKIEQTGVGLIFTDAVRHYVEDNTDIGYFSYMGHAPRRGDAFADQLLCYTIVNSAALFRRTSLEKLGRGIDPTLRICTDFDLFMRIVHEDGADFIDEKLAVYNVAPGSTIASKADLVAEELERLMNGMIARWPDIERRYPAQLQAFRRNIALQRAKAFWRQGHGRQARRYLWPHLPATKPLLALGGTFFPYAGMMAMWSWLQRARRGRAV